MHAQRYGACMHAARNDKPKVFFQGDRYNSLVKDLGLASIDDKAEDLGVNSGNLSRIMRGQPVSAEFIARVQLKYPNVPFERLFRAGLA